MSSFLVETESNTNITIDNLSSVDQMDPDLAGEEDIRVAVSVFVIVCCLNC